MKTKLDTETHGICPKLHYKFTALNYLLKKKQKIIPLKKSIKKQKKLCLKINIEFMNKNQKMLFMNGKINQSLGPGLWRIKQNS